MHPFGTAVVAGDIDAALAQLAEDVIFHSPVVHRPYQGRAAVAPILHAVSAVFEDFRYVDEIGGPDAASHVLVFRTRVGDREIEGIDLLHTGAGGLVDELTVMVRPLSGAMALAEVMRARLAAGA
jgi:SnoaL-like protein